MLQRYLRLSSTEYMWWKLGYEKYSKVCAESPNGCAPEAQLRAANHTLLREVAAVDLGGGKSIRVGESCQDAVSCIGVGPSRAPARRIRYPQYTLDVVASDVFIAIILNGKGAPELLPRRIGAGTSKARSDMA